MTRDEYIAWLKENTYPECVWVCPKCSSTWSLEELAMECCMPSKGNEKEVK